MRYINIVGPAHSIIGYNFFDIVDEIGSAAKRSWRVGDRIRGVVYGSSRG